MAGIANKTGYDIEMLYGDLIVQPSNVISYTYANAEDYTNAANVDIKSKGIHLLQNKPTLTLINNHENAWQLYGSIAYAMNFMKKTDFSAEGAELTKMKLHNYMEYNLGVQKLFEKSEMYLKLTKQHGKDRDNLIGTMGYRYNF